MKNGFTLLELLVVIGVVGILVAVGVPAYQGHLASAKVKAAETNFQRMNNFILAEIAKCNLGQNLQGGSANGLAWNTLNCATGRSALRAYDFHLYFDNYLESVFKNSWNPSGTDWVIGGSITGGKAKYGLTEVMPANANGSTNNNGTHLRLSMNIGHINGSQDVIKTILIPLND